VAKGQSVFLWSADWLCKVQLDEFKANSSASYSGLRRKASRSSKRKHDDDDATTTTNQDEHPGEEEGSTIDSNGAKKDVARAEQSIPNAIRVVKNYRDVLLLDFIGPDELIVVERPLTDILRTLPPAYFKSKYGSG
jgi:U3 small nucleolar RNA-associated protein 4